METVLRIDSRVAAIVKLESNGLGETMKRIAKIVERIVMKRDCKLIVGIDFPESKD